jgi:hypothetical protein
MPKEKHEHSREGDDNKDEQAHHIRIRNVHPFCTLMHPNAQHLHRRPHTQKSLSTNMHEPGRVYPVYHSHVEEGHQHTIRRRVTDWAAIFMPYATK